MAPLAALGEVDVGARVSVDVGADVGVDVVPLVELLPHASSKTTSIRLLKASIDP